MVEQFLIWLLGPVVTIVFAIAGGLALLAYTTAYIASKMEEY